MYLLFKRIGKDCCKRRIGLYKLSKVDVSLQQKEDKEEEERRKKGGKEGKQHKVQRHLKMLKQQSKISTSKKLQPQVVL